MIRNSALKNSRAGRRGFTRLILGAIALLALLLVLWFSGVFGERAVAERDAEVEVPADGGEAAEGADAGAAGGD